MESDGITQAQTVRSNEAHGRPQEPHAHLARVSCQQLLPAVSSAAHPTRASSCQLRLLHVDQLVPAVANCGVFAVDQLALGPELVGMIIADGEPTAVIAHRHKVRATPQSSKA